MLIPGWQSRPAPRGTPERVVATPRRASGFAVRDGRIFVAFPRWDGADTTLLVLEQGAWHPYPDAAMQDLAAGPQALHSVNGLRLDARGYLWILDNARVDLRPAPPGAAKLVVWDVVHEREVFRHVFSEEASPPGRSFLNDLAVDEEDGYVYITDTGMGGPAALVVLELATGRDWRALVGHPALEADPARVMSAAGVTMTRLTPDREEHAWRVGANPIAWDAHRERLLFGAMTSDDLFALPRAALQDPELSDVERVALLEYVGRKPASDGMAWRRDGLALITDVEGAAIWCLDAEGGLARMAHHPEALFPVAIFLEGPETVWFSASALHGMPLLHAGEERAPGPWGLWRFALPEGTVCAPPAAHPTDEATP